MRARPSQLSIVLALLLGAPARGGEETRWYLVEFSSGEHLSARFIAEEKDFYIFNFQGAPLVIAKSGIVKISPLSPPEAAAASSGFSAAPRSPEEARAAPQAPAPKDTAAAPAPPQAGGGGAGPEGPLTDEAIRDAIEVMALDDDRMVASAYRSLRRGFPAGRALIHEASRHQSPRVRALCLKLLGERGAAKDDLRVVADRLSDEKAPVRLAAGKALRTLGPEGLPDLITYLPSEREPNIRKMAIQTLKDWRDQRAVAPLVGLLDKEPDHGVRRFIVGSLETLTHQNLGDNSRAWRDYLSQDKFNGEVLHQMEEEKARDEAQAREEARAQAEVKAWESGEGVEEETKHE
jgi:HEAT repeat protein